MTTSTMQPEIISTETIKPSSPTPQHLRSFKLSLLDQITPCIPVPIVLFYPNVGSDHSPGDDIAHRSAQLKKSLSRTLTQYYPFAGRIKDTVSIDCNDDGVDFLEARIKCQLSEILEHPEIETLNLLFSGALRGSHSNMGSILLAVQISFFDCGGMAVGVCFSHKITDASTASTFINYWATMAHHESVGDVLCPEFITASVFPPSDLLIMPEAELERGKFFSRRFVFDASKISDLKAKAAISSGVHNPTRVEVVTALIYKCAIAASRANSSGSLRPSMLAQTVNMRRRMVPQLPDNSVGNLVWYFPAVTPGEQSEIELNGLVGQMREGMTQLCTKYSKNVQGDERMLKIFESMKEAENLLSTKNNVDVYRCSSWCRYPLYQLDFGWGKPVWATTASNNGLKNIIMLMDTRSGDGIEAWVTLEEQDMAVFERDGELLAYASSSPTALGTNSESILVAYE